MLLSSYENNLPLLDTLLMSPYCCFRQRRGHNDQTDDFALCSMFSTKFPLGSCQVGSITPDLLTKCLHYVIRYPGDSLRHFGRTGPNLKCGHCVSELDSYMVMYCAWMEAPVISTEPRSLHNIDQHFHKPFVKTLSTLQA